MSQVITKSKLKDILILAALLLVCTLATECITGRSSRHSRDIPKNCELPTLTVNRPEQIIEHLGYTLSFNPKWNIPNWVAYELTASEVGGDEERSDNFSPDPLVIGDPVVTGDYVRSGYDRGHMAPAADMKWSEQAMDECFYMTNICPQNHNNNAGDWKGLEEQVRDWARAYGSVYVACGPVVYDASKSKTIGTARKIVVPDAFYKVILRRLSAEEMLTLQTSSPLTCGWTAIGFLMPNEAGTQPLMSYMKTVDELEKLLGIDFFASLPEKAQREAESDYCVEAWSLPKSELTLPKKR